MLAVNFAAVHEDFGKFCDAAVDDKETIVVTREDETKVVLMGLAEYDELMKQVRNGDYLLKLDHSTAQLERGEGREHGLIVEETEPDEWDLELLAAAKDDPESQEYIPLEDVKKELGL